MTDLIARIDLLREKEDRGRSRLKKLLYIVNNSLNQRQKAYLELKDKLAKLIINRGETQKKLKTLERNIVIYAKNLEKIDTLINENHMEMADIKLKYDTLLTGPVSNVIEYTGEPSSINPGIKPGAKNAYMFIKLRKQSLINSLNTIFQQYESEIDIMEEKEKALLEKKEAITKKKDTAFHQRELLLTDQESYNDEIQRIHDPIKISGRELKSVLFIYQGIIRKLQLSSSLNKKYRTALMQGVNTF